MLFFSSGFVFLDEDSDSSEERGIGSNVPEPKIDGMVEDSTKIQGLEIHTGNLSLPFSSVIDWLITSGWKSFVESIWIILFELDESVHELALDTSLDDAESLSCLLVWRCLCTPDNSETYFIETDENDANKESESLLVMLEGWSSSPSECL